jgi:hypothetical protein
MNKRSILILLAALVIVVVNGLFAHFVPPSGIEMTPAILICTTFIIVFGLRDLNPLLKSLLTFLFIAINDISIKLYAGGIHDREGLDWVDLFLLIGLVPAFILLLVSIIRDKKSTLINKLAAIVLFPLLVYGHEYFFGELGLGRAYV